MLLKIFINWLISAGVGDGQLDLVEPIVGSRWLISFHGPMILRIGRHFIYHGIEEG